MWQPHKHFYEKYQLCCAKVLLKNTALALNCLIVCLIIQFFLIVGNPMQNNFFHKQIIGTYFKCFYFNITAFDL